MNRESFNSGWMFCRGSGTALERTISGAQTPVPVTLPHDAMIAQARDPKRPPAIPPDITPPRPFTIPKNSNGMRFQAPRFWNLKASITTLQFISTAAWRRSTITAIPRLPLTSRHF